MYSSDCKIPAHALKKDMGTETKRKQHFFIAGLNIVVREDL
jgi:hypothetical protein